MPVGPYATFGDCVAAQRRRGRSEDSARRICGAIEAQTQKQVTEHALRVRSPRGFVRFRRRRLTRGVIAIIGFRNGGSEVQALRFDPSVFTPAEARQWARDHDFAIQEFTPAVKQDADRPAVFPGFAELFSGLAKMFGGATPDPDIPDDIEPVEIDFEIAKLNDDERLVFGWANVSMRADGEVIVDRQGDIIEPVELEKAAYEFVLDFRESGVNHKGDVKGRLVESLVVTPEKLQAMGLAKDALPTGWWIGVKIDDPDVFKRVKKGELAMFSIQGSAQREAA